MATVNNAVVNILDNQVTVQGTNVTIGFTLQTDTGRYLQASVTIPISNTAGQLAQALLSAVQDQLAARGDTMPANASLMVLGGIV